MIIAKTAPTRCCRAAVSSFIQGGAQAEMRDEGIEIPVAVQQREVVVDAACCDERVDSFAYCHAALP